ncbi:MAG TPA: hypothetical protein VN420_04690 [Candidatus Fimivivens sp.]|nr:hypothetical protein [Candidatus Fimivivens sp.]
MLRIRHTRQVTSPVIFFVLLIGLMWPSQRDTGRAHAEDDYTWQYYDNFEVIDKDTVWQGSFVQKNFWKPVVVVNGATLTIEKGTKVEISHLSVYNGKIIAEGTDTERIVITPAPSYLDIGDGGLGNCDAECFRQRPEGVIEFNDYTEKGNGPSIFRYVVFDKMGSDLKKYVGKCPVQVMNRPSWRSFLGETAHAVQNIDFSSPSIDFVAGNVDMDHCSFRNGAIADIRSNVGISDDWNSYVFLRVTNSDFEGNLKNTALLSNAYYNGVPDGRRLYFGNNWYGSADGPKTTSNPDSSGEIVSGPAIIDGFSTTRNLQDAQAASNVLFLPGIKASKLAMNTDHGTKDELWPPDFFSNDLSDLALDGDGDSVNRVYTDGVLASAGGSDFYKSFVADLEKMKSDGVINDFDPFAYDWRMSVKDVAYGNTATPGDYRSLLESAEQLAHSSKSGKVTVIAHSNGGLVAKELLRRLDAMGEAGLVDQVVFVGTPQMGTPITILSLLYGYDEEIFNGWLVSRKDARALVENMPGAYGLLPSAEYFDRSKGAIVSFSSKNTRFKTYLDAYGGKIDDWGTLADFLSGKTDGRQKPAKSDVSSENILRSNILSDANDIHEDVDTWSPPAGVEAVQIAGWGLDTIRGVDFTERKKAACYPSIGSGLPSCVETDRYEPIYEPKFTVDGDKVVTAPSALMLSETTNVKKYWVDLVSEKQNHANLFENQSLRIFLSRIILHSINGALPEKIFASKPESSVGSKRIRMSLYSPLDIHLTDAVGNQTGSVEVDANGTKYKTFEEHISGSTYYEFDGRKYVSFPEGVPIDIRLSGYDSGSYSLSLQEVAVTPDGEETLSHTDFANLPVTPQTTVDLSVPAQGLSGLSDLHADVNGTDAGGQYVVKPVPNGSATLVVDRQAPVTTATVSGKPGKNGWYLDSVTVTLAGDDGTDGTGVDRTEYSFDNGSTWSTYFGAISVTKAGETDFSFASVDKAGNREETKSSRIMIDRTAPEARIGFDSATRALFVTGKDDLSGTVSVSIAETAVPKIKRRFRDVATLTDEAGHRTVVTYDRTEQVGNHILINPLSVSYDGGSPFAVQAEADYQWFPGPVKKGYLYLLSQLQNSTEVVISDYFPKPDQTLVIRYPKYPSRSAPKASADWLQRLVVPVFETRKGVMNMVY